MRLCTPVSLCLAAAAALLPAGAPAAALAAPPPTCAEASRFPLTTRIHNGPATYEAGGGYGLWDLQLTNTTARTCTDVHPVVVIVDGARSLKPAQARLEFYEGERPHPVRFEVSDADELVGAFDDGFAGFTVGPRGTVTVKVRLAFTSDAAPDGVTVNAAVVQRHDEDGAWVGQSNDYRFEVESDPDPAASEPTASTADPASPSAPATRRDEGLPFARDAEELARTGLGTPHRTLATLATAAALLVAGGTLLLARKTWRRR
ncbi:hypothetical protein [Streptomyces pseudovenezuelae]|uniref:Gram-positive cocci surface proteins LPxTG domain-containing protein n=1 Tax=Streptomyces pseudovenezuelae TaxID=67350 RepID=A0ABT6LI41_9ACTN|nr:hypothetical protein [Streptomyces pseudovenezuelae]MDH6215975.1 hypothetical protein [Streptomyces pseudovenezuelae]